MAIVERLLAPDSPFQRRFYPLARRFVAGETVDDALAAVAALNADGLSATLDFLGEDVTEPAEAERTRDAYLTLLGAIRARGVDANVSVKLTAMGLLLGEDVAYANLRTVIDAAARNPDPFVRVDMEGSAVVEATLRVVERAYATTRDVGPVLQAYLRRTPDDTERMIGLGARVRLCKGAYREPAEIALQEMEAIRRQYLRCAEQLLARGRYPGIATHDPRLIAAVATYAREHGIDPQRFEFQMLYGVRPETQRALVREGWRVRVYVPYGTHWAGYFYRRISERRANAFFALRSLLER